jgi:hypothetical protein
VEQHCGASSLKGEGKESLARDRGRVTSGTPRSFGIGAIRFRRDDMNAASVARQVVRVVADGTGRSPGEVWTILVATMALRATRATVLGVLWFVDFAAEGDVAPSPPRRDARVSTSPRA